MLDTLVFLAGLLNAASLWRSCVCLLPGFALGAWLWQIDDVPFGPGWLWAVLAVLSSAALGIAWELRAARRARRMQRPRPVPE